MDSCKYLGDLIPSDEELLELKFGWLIWIKTQNVDESKMRAILCSCAEQMGRGQSACWTRTVRRGSSWTADGPRSEVRTVREYQIFQISAELSYISKDWFYDFSNCSYG